MENLRQLMAAYFHQDWWDEYDGAWRLAVADFARRAPERVPALEREIASLLDERPTDAQVSQLLDEMGNYRHPGDEPDAHIAWLVDIRSLLDEIDHQTNSRTS